MHTGPALAGYVTGGREPSDARLCAPAFERNGDAIRDALADVLPNAGQVLEIASGSGEHIVHIARAFGRLRFQPSDHDSAARASIDAWVKQSKLANVLPALRLDATDPVWGIEMAEVVLCINMVHIAPWAATLGLFANATRILPHEGTLTLYGPLDRAGTPLAASNAAFDADLRARNPAWGLRHLDALTALAAGFAPPEIIEMPANNILVTFRRTRR